MLASKTQPHERGPGGHHRSVAAEYGGGGAVVVAVKAEKMISNTALAWALTHVVHPGDCITMLAVHSSNSTKTGKKRFWNFPRLTGECGTHRELPDRICEISESCSQMMLQLHNRIEVGVKIKVVSSTAGTAVLAEARGCGANWVVVDKKLKQELKCCIEELHCNIVAIKGTKAKVHRLNLGCLNDVQTPYCWTTSSPNNAVLGVSQGSVLKHSTTPASSPEAPTTSLISGEMGGSMSSYERETPLLLICDQNQLLDGTSKEEEAHESTNVAVSPHRRVFWIPENDNFAEKMYMDQKSKNIARTRPPSSRSLLEKFLQYDRDSNSTTAVTDKKINEDEFITSKSIRNLVPLSRTSSIPPPLCSLCQHKAPVFGKPPWRFSYEELEEATAGFSDMNFLSEGGFGNVYRGVLTNGQVVAVKLLKYVGSQADADFAREVRVLSCAQHRNVVLLIGFCIDGKNRILVYEFICNGSLDTHLHGNKTMQLDWQSRLKVAIGTARGLRYLHEDCRVGCIVHRDMRPNNILVTHDFEPLVSDFGLARWNSETISTEERVIGTSGYLAPEYIDGGIIRQAVDVYAFGMVLLELITGRRISELQSYIGNNFLHDWLHALRSSQQTQIFTSIYQLLDPCLTSDQQLREFPHQLQAMARAAACCLHRDPESRPPMSKVLRILEGGELAVPVGHDLNSIGSRSAHFRGVGSHKQSEMRPSHSRKLSH